MHLTAQLSKSIERVLGGCFLPYLERIGAAGPCQFAYRKRRGLRDALAFLTMSWILALSKGDQVGLYCSDVSGAFDRVSAQRLLLKLRQSGVHPKILALIKSWLIKRTATVVVDGTKSTLFHLSNSVYQGTT